MGARSIRKDPEWTLTDWEKAREQGDELQDLVIDLTRHGNDQALEILQSEKEAVESGELFHSDDYGKQLLIGETDHVDELRAELQDLLFEMGCNSMEAAICNLNAGIRRVKARKRLQREREAFARLKPERKEKVRKQFRNE